MLICPTRHIHHFTPGHPEPSTDDVQTLRHSIPCIVWSSSSLQFTSRLLTRTLCASQYGLLTQAPSHFHSPTLFMPFSWPEMSFFLFYLQKSRQLLKPILTLTLSDNSNHRELLTPLSTFSKCFPLIMF